MPKDYDKLTKNLTALILRNEELEGRILMVQALVWSGLGDEQTNDDALTALRAINALLEDLINA